MRVYHLVLTFGSMLLQHAMKMHEGLEIERRTF
jgi:hypothetical protein